MPNDTLSSVVSWSTIFGLALSFKSASSGLNCEIAQVANHCSGTIELIKVVGSD